MVTRNWCCARDAGREERPSQEGSIILGSILIFRQETGQQFAAWTHLV